MRATIRNVFIATSVVAASVALGGRLIGWRVVGQWITGWWTPGWGNLFVVSVAVATLIYALRNNRTTLEQARHQFAAARKDSRVEKLRAEIAALVTAVDEQQSTDIKMRPGLFDALKAAGLQTSGGVITAPLEYEAQNEATRQGMILAEPVFEETVSPVYRRIAAHSFGVLMLTEDPKIIDPVQRIEECAAAEWRYRRGLFRAASESVNALQFYKNLLELQAAEGPDSKKRQAEIQAARDELRRYCRERFSTLAEA